MLAQQLFTEQAVVENQYRRVVKPDGNPLARQIVRQVYEPINAVWRGFGSVENSGLIPNERYRRFDAACCVPVTVEAIREPDQCRCGEVLRGTIKPLACPLFGKACVPENPVGSCMVSVEGTCAAWYKYGAGRWQF